MPVFKRKTRAERLALARKQEGQRRARIVSALQLEALGDHPEQVLIVWRPQLYRGGYRHYVRLPGLKIELLVGSEEESTAAKLAMEAGVEAWCRGEMVGQQFLCTKCKGDMGNE